MKIILIAALSADGYIAKDPSEPSTVWTSKEDKKHFMELSKKAGVLVMGEKTFETIGQGLPGRRTIICTNKEIKGKDIETTNLNPEELVKKLEKEGVKELAVCGGATMYTLFMKSGLVDELFLTIDPIVFGSGLSLFKEKISAKLELVSLEKSGNSIFLHYKIIKS